MNFSTCKLYRCCYNQMTKINELRQRTTVITSTTNVTTLWERRHSQEWQTRLETSRQKERTSRCCAYIGWTMYCRISSIRKPVALTNYSLTWQKKNIWKPVLEGNLFNFHPNENMPSLSTTNSIIYHFFSFNNWRISSHLFVHTYVVMLSMFSYLILKRSRMGILQTQRN